MKRIFVLFAVAVVVIIVGYIMMNYSPKNQSTSPTPSPIAVASETPIAEVVHVIMKTARGDIELELYPQKAPKTVANFVKLATDKFYDGTKFHRVIADFMIQGGDPLSRTDDPRTGQGGPGYQFEDEINDLKVIPGVIAMANAGANTNGSQFFIVTTRPQTHLDGVHTVFGRVTAGMDVVLKIQQGDVLISVQIP